MNVNCVESLGVAFITIVRKPLLGVITHYDGAELGYCEGYEHTFKSLAETPPMSASLTVRTATVSFV